MKTTTIKTPDKLLALRNAAGVIEIDHNLVIECDVPWADVGANITGINVGGYLNCGGYLYCGGDLNCGGYLYCGGDLNCRGEYFACTDLYWSHASMPTLPERNFIRRVLPPMWQKNHWQERLGIRFGDGCYETIFESLLPKIAQLLGDSKWSTTERWMMETLRDNWKAKLPQWVTDIRAHHTTAEDA